MTKARRKRVVGSNPSWCYLCGLPIPVGIASSRHPLYGTVDHVIPVSRNGTDALHNRLPAHRLCNEQKGNHMIHPEEFAIELRARVLPLLESVGCSVTARMQRAAVRRVPEAWPDWAPICRRGARPRGHRAVGGRRRKRHWREPSLAKPGGARRHRRRQRITQETATSQTRVPRAYWPIGK